MTFWRPAARNVHTVLLLALALCWSLPLAAWHLAGRESLLDRLEYTLLDLRFLMVGPRPAPKAVVIVAIDDEAVREAGAYPLPRSTLTRLVHTIAEHQPKAIGIDILLLDRAQTGMDTALATTLGEAHAVLAGAAIFSRSGQPVRDKVTKLPIAEHVMRPLERFRTGTGLGLVNVVTDYSGTPRFLPLLISEEQNVLPGFALRVVAQASGTEPVLGTNSLIVGTVSTWLDLGFSLPLRFYGPRGSVQTLSAAAVLKNDSMAEIIHGRIVMIGATAFGISDTFATPYDPILPGIEVLATGVDHLAAGDGLVRDDTVRSINALIAVAFAVSAAIIFAFVPIGLSIGMISLAVFLWIATTIIAFANNIWLDTTLPPATLVPIVAFGLGSRLVLDRRDAQRMAAAEQTLRTFHPPRLAARIARDPSFLFEPLMQFASILFLDLSGFTGVSERLGPQATQGLLKNFHRLVEACVSRHGGIVVAFMGDGAMCVFGLAEPDPDDARHALAAALDLVPAVRTWLAEQNAFGGIGDLRVGVHHGAVVVSRLGSATHQHITATGDSVNLASRLMEVGKSLSAALVVSDDLLAAAGENAAKSAAFEGQSDVMIRGRMQPITVSYRWQRAIAHGSPEE